MKRIPSLDGLRAISVSLVLIGHLARAGHTPDGLSMYAANGVRMFFVISGYLMTTILLNEHARTSGINLREFYIRRAPTVLFRLLASLMLFATVAYWRELRWIDIGTMFYTSRTTTQMRRGWWDTFGRWVFRNSFTCF